MRILDCENTLSMYKSLENISGISQKELKKFIAKFDFDEFQKDNPHSFLRSDEILLKIFEEEYNPSLKFDYTCWFHLTRTFQFDHFKDGILPLGDILDDIWKFLFRLIKNEFSKKDWENYRKSLESGELKREVEDVYGELYRSKINNPIHWGPYAMLIRDSAFKSREIGNHDYLGVPEIVEDICVPFDKIHDFGLLNKYKNNTKSCIIKFKSKSNERYFIGTVLNYLHCIHNKERMYINCNTCFDNKGNKISSKNILKIEYLNE